MLSPEAQERYARVLRYSVDWTGTDTSDTLTKLIDFGLREIHLREFDPEQGNHQVTVYSALWGLCYNHYTMTGHLLDGKALWSRFRDGTADLVAKQRGQTKEAVLAEARVAFRQAYDDTTANGSDVELLVETLQEVYEQAEILRLLAEGARNAGKMKPRILLANLIARGHEIEEGVSNRSGVTSLKGSVEARVARYERICANPEEAEGLHTGFSEFDRRTGGLYGGEVALITGPTKGGKSLIRDRILANMFLAGHSVVSILSEFRGEAALNRVETMLLADAGVEPEDPQVSLSQALKRGGLQRESRDRYYSLLRGLGDLPGEFLFIEPDAYRRLDDLEGLIASLVQRYNVRAIACDDLHNQVLSGGQEERDDLRQGSVMNLLSSMAIRHNVAVLGEVQEDRSTYGKRHLSWASAVKYSQKITQKCHVGIRLFTAMPQPMFPELQVLAHRSAPDGFAFRILLDKERLAIGDAPAFLAAGYQAPEGTGGPKKLEEIVGAFVEDDLEEGEIPMAGGL